MGISQSGTSLPLFSLSNWNFNFFLWREENWSTQRKTLGARMRTKHKLNPHMMPGPRFEPGLHWWGEGFSPLRHPCLSTRESRKWRQRLKITSQVEINLLNHLYDYRPNWTPLSPLLIIYYLLFIQGNFMLPHNQEPVVHCGMLFRWSLFCSLLEQWYPWCGSQSF